MQTTVEVCHQGKKKREFKKYKINTNLKNDILTCYLG